MWSCSCLYELQIGGFCCLWSQLNHGKCCSEKGIYFLMGFVYVHYYFCYLVLDLLELWFELFRINVPPLMPMECLIFWSVPKHTMFVQGKYGFKMKQLPFMGVICSVMLFIVYRTTNYQYHQTKVRLFSLYGNYTCTHTFWSLCWNCTFIFIFPLQIETTLQPFDTTKVKILWFFLIFFFTKIGSVLAFCRVRITFSWLSKIFKLYSVKWNSVGNLLLYLLG